MEVVKIKKYNEVYIKIECEPSISFELKDYFSFKVPGYQFMPAYKNKMWTGDIYLFNPLTGLIYAGLLSYVEEFCKSRKYKVEHLSDFSAENFSVKEAEDFIKKIKPTLEPRDYQIDAFVHAVREKRSLLLSPTASGKSFIIYLLARYYATRTLIIVPTTSLVSQLASDFADYGFRSDEYVHRIFSGQDKLTDKPITISTWQSIYKMPRDFFSSFHLVIGDEAHLFKAKSLTSIMDKLPACQHRFGFTGTLDGTQTHKLVLEGMFGPVRKVTTTKELMDKKHVSDFSIKAIVLSHTDEDRKLIAKTKNYQDEMDFIVSCKSRNKFIRNLALSLKGNSLLLFQYVDKHGKILYDDIVKHAGDRKVFFVSGEVDGDQREDIRRIVENEHDAIIVASFGVYSTGVNIKNLHNLIFTSPSKSRIRNLQSIGRGLRKSDNKTSATLYDIADDLTWKSNKNFTLLHFMERVKVYNEEQFSYRIYKVSLSGS